MEWRSHFKAAFFSAWLNGGFPDPSTRRRAYSEFCAAIPLPERLTAGTADASGPLAAATLQEVYGFGVFVGHAIGRLLSLPAGETERRADWCGRFNLGISLFDHLCDEAGIGEALLGTPPFDRLLLDSVSEGPRQKPTAPASAAERYLCGLAADVMAELELEVGALNHRPRPDSLWRSLGKMMRAETLTTHLLQRQGRAYSELVDVARAKSAGPFGVMAEWMILGAKRDSVSRKKANDLGHAIGECYWLVDDARDLWEDLDAGHSNLFLLAASRKGDDLLGKSCDALAEIRVSKILMTHGWVEQIVAPAISRAKELLEKVPASRAERDAVMGLFAVSMDRWLG